MSAESTIFVTGATGFIGMGLCQKLASEGYRVKALIRDREKARSFLTNKNIELIEGDIENLESLQKGTEDVSGVYHLAGFVEPWHRDPSIYHRINVRGTENVLQASLENNVKRLVMTSTAGVFGPRLGSEPVTEKTRRQLPLTTQYEATKEEGELLAKSYANRGLDVVIVNPTRVYGPGIMSKSNSVTILIDRYIRGKWRALPGDGSRLGNYVYIDDVIKGHILAMKNGLSGENYLLGGETASYTALFRAIGEISGKSYRMFPLPSRIVMAVSYIEQWKASIFGIAPLITPGFAKKYLFDWDNSSLKAIDRLGYNPRTLAEGITLTHKWLQDRN